MKMSNLKKSAVAAAVAFISTIAATSASADVIYEFSNTSTANYNNSLLSGSSGIFATANFKDVSSGVVLLTLNVLSTLPSNNYVDNWTFNLGNSTNISSITYVSGAKGVASTAPITGAANNVSNGTDGGNFDLGFSFESLRPKALKAGDSAVYTLTGSFDFDATDFLTANDNGIYAAVHVAGGNNNSHFKALNTDGVATSANNVPEPTTTALLGLGLLGFAASRRKSAKA